jgi:DNA replication protein DnaC
VSDKPMSAAERAAAIRAMRAQYGLDVSTPEEVMLRRRVPKRFWEIAKAPKETLALTYVRAILEGKGVLLVLHGNAGCGKSSAAAWALLQREGLWVNAPDLSRPPTEDEDASDRELATTPFLVIDDIGIEYSTDKKYAESRINLALSKREASLLPTVLTTNLSTEEFKNRYGDRTASRLNGDPLGWQTVAGADMRMGRHNPTAFNERGERGE